MEALDAIPWGALTPAAMLMIAVLLILRGDIHPRRTVERELAAKDKIIDTQQKAIDIKDAHITTLADTNRTLSNEVGQTVARVMDELQARARKGADGS